MAAPYIVPGVLISASAATTAIGSSIEKARAEANSNAGSIFGPSADDLRLTDGPGRDGLGHPLTLSHGWIFGVASAPHIDTGESRGLFSSLLLGYWRLEMKSNFIEWGLAWLAAWQTTHHP